MARRMPTPCRFRRCSRTCTDGSGYCAEHGQQVSREMDRRRGSSRERGYTTTWEKARARWLWQHPLCAECGREGRIVPATVVDHVVPHRGDMDLFWREDNWQSLCVHHHNAKTAKEGRWG